MDAKKHLNKEMLSIIFPYICRNLIRQSIKAAMLTGLTVEFKSLSCPTGQRSHKRKTDASFAVSITPYILNLMLFSDMASASLLITANLLTCYGLQNSTIKVSCKSLFLDFHSLFLQDIQSVSSIALAKAMRTSSFGI